MKVKLRNNMPGFGKPKHHNWRLVLLAVGALLVAAISGLQP